MKRLYFLLLFSFPPLLLAQNYSYLSTHGGTLSDHFLDVIATTDSGYAAVGVSSSFSASTDVYMVKFDKNNTVEWSRVIGGPGIDWGYAISQLPDSGFVIAGFSSSFSNGDFDGIIFRTDKLGLNVSHTLYGGNDWDFFYGLAPTNDSGFVACGETYSGTNGYSDAWVMKLDKNLVIQWDLSYGGNDDECANSIIQTYDSNFVFCGTTRSFSLGEEDAWVVKLNQIGDTLFTRSYGDSLTENVFTVLEHNIDSGLVLGGEIRSSTGNPVSSDALRLKFSKTGQYMWSHADGFLSDDYVISDFMQLPDGKLIACGKTPFGAGGSDVLNYVTDPGGWWLPYSPTYGGLYDDYAKAMTKSLKGQYILAGSTESFGAGMFDGLIIIADSVSSNYTASTFSSSDSLVGISPSSFQFQQITCYPNPASDFIQFSSATGTSFEQMNIVDMQGREIYTLNRVGNQYHVPLRSFSNGMYIAIIKQGEIFSRIPFSVYR